MHPNADVRIRAMMCLAEIIRLYYPNINNYMDPITVLTFEIIEKDAEEVATLAIEVW